MRTQPALEQDVERPLGDRDAADVLDIGAGHRLVIGDDRQGLERGAGELALHIVFAREQP